ncbi:sodium-dependent bicarbonate transport family permease [Methylobacterium tarhaniae]|uniref:sodium-dependent bicarbonate transport family permease n=1 Tax=Methylobacterium tarhaniae TaxID=1187852 RepID=UPI000A4379BA|nr:sodium-dependent bicarbonate transport family permease [Methylobacterium tarhaniae]
MKPKWHGLLYNSEGANRGLQVRVWSGVRTPFVWLRTICRISLELCLACSLAVTFPFNIALGLPLYQAMAQALYG